MNIKQASWASKHDWFIRSYGDFDVCPTLENAEDSYTVVVKCFVEIDGEIMECVGYFDNFEALKAWAGY